jgi:hypothetical protein
MSFSLVSESSRITARPFSATQSIGDGTLAMLRDEQVPVIAGVNMGVAWNKKRTLLLISQMLGCEMVAAWLRAARRWGHMNFAADWYQVAGQGMGEQHFRAPWRDDIQLRQFHPATASATSEGYERFRLTPAETHPAVARQARRGLFSSLVRRA